jgi:hypothetical protein
MRAPPLALFALLACAAFLQVGCSSLDAAVFVQPSIDAPEVNVNPGVLGITLEGSFSLRLHLGPRASGSSEVSLGALSLASARDQATIVSPLAVKTVAAMPIVVAPDRDVTTPFTIDAGGKPLPFDAKAKLCEPAGLVILGAVDDPLASAATPVSSAVFQPTGCK